jgi:hypothetical protein
VIDHCIMNAEGKSRFGTQHVCKVCKGPVHNRCVWRVMGDAFDPEDGHYCDKHFAKVSKAVIKFKVFKV